MVKEKHAEEVKPDVLIRKSNNQIKAIQIENMSFNSKFQPAGVERAMWERLGKKRLIEKARSRNNGKRHR